MKGVRQAVRASGCTFQLRQDRAQLYIPVKLVSSNSGWHRGWFYLCNDDGALPPYTGRVLTSKPERRRYGMLTADQDRLELLLAALARL